MNMPLKMFDFRMFDFKMFLKQPLSVAVLINLFFLFVCLAFGRLRFGAIDDYFMAAVLTGAHGTDYNPHLLFVNALYGYLLLPLYHLLPKVGWYYIGEMAAVFVGFTTICYVLVRKLGCRWGALLSALFVAFFASDFYLVLQFTQCASLLSASGMLSFAFAVSERSIKNLPLMVLGAVLLFWGSIMRWEAFLMGMPFFALGLLLQIKNCWKLKIPVLAIFAAMVVAAFYTHHWDRELYTTDEYKYYMAFQGPRAGLGDGSNYNQNAVYEDLEEVGKSGKDYHMTTSWLFYDTEVFSVDSLHAMLSMVVQYRDRVARGQIPATLMGALKHSMQSPLFWIWLVFSLLLIWRKNLYALYPWISLSIILGLMAYLLGAGRLVYRVESGFWLYATCLAVPFLQQIKVALPKKILYVTLAVIAVCNLAVYASSGEMVRDPSSGKMRTLELADDTTDYKQVFDFIDSNPDKMFLLSMNAYMRFSHHKMPPYLAEPIGSYRNTISFGYWTPYLPEITQALQEYGVENPMRDVVHDNVIVLNEGNLCDYLQRHYYDSVAVDTLRSIGEMTFYKYRLVTADSSKLAAGSAEYMAGSVAEGEHD